MHLDNLTTDELLHRRAAEEATARQMDVIWAEERLAAQSAWACIEAIDRELARRNP